MLKLNSKGLIMKVEDYIKYSEWVLQYLDNEATIESIDILDADFVEAFIKQFNPKSYWYVYGAPKVPILGPLLSKMYHEGKLNRYATGLQCHEWGFPNWVYSYRRRNNE